MPYVEYDEVVASCSECGRTFRSEEDLEVHKAEVHAAPASPPSPPIRAPPASSSPGGGDTRHRRKRGS
jgi:hypothetical protein